MVTCSRRVSNTFTPVPCRHMRFAVSVDLLSCDLTPSSGRRGLHRDHSPRRVAFLEGDIVPLRIVFSLVVHLAALFDNSSWSGGYGVVNDPAVLTVFGRADLRRERLAHKLFGKLLERLRFSVIAQGSRQHLPGLRPRSDLSRGEKAK